MKRKHQIFHPTRENVYIGNSFASPIPWDDRHHRPVNRTNNNSGDITQVGHTGVRGTNEVTLHNIPQSTTAEIMVYTDAPSSSKEEHRMRGMDKSRVIHGTAAKEKGSD